MRKQNRVNHSSDVHECEAQDERVKNSLPRIKSEISVPERLEDTRDRVCRMAHLLVRINRCMCDYRGCMTSVNLEITRSVRIRDSRDHNGPVCVRAP